MELPRILVVDDYVDAVATLAALLRFLNCRVRTCYDGRECIQAVRDFLPQAVLLDLAMPHHDGFEIAKEIRELGLHYELIAVTGCVDEATRVRCAELGFDSFLVKPTPLEELRRIVENIRSRISADKSASPN